MHNYKIEPLKAIRELHPKFVERERERERSIRVTHAQTFVF